MSAGDFGAAIDALEQLLDEIERPWLRRCVRRLIVAFEARMGLDDLLLHRVASISAERGAL